METSRSDVSKGTVEFYCDWNECSYKDLDENSFYKHVTNHIGELRIISSNDGGDMYECSWKNCAHNSDNSKEITRHVKFHGYHAILKAKGIAVSLNRNLPPCNYSESESSHIQPWINSLICRWEDCEHELTGLREFIAHVQSHISSICHRPLKCGWEDCHFQTHSIKSKLSDHVKVHTGERVVACPVCGNTFANTTKYADHCIRQKTSIDEDSYRCGYCFTYLPSERIYRDHMRQHVHHHQCTSCDLTCHSPSVLIEHIRYRHLPYKPFKCSSCPHSCKSAFDLKQHLKSHTKDVHCYSCTGKNCDFKCKRQSSLMRHYYKVHNEGNRVGGVFVCHLCEKNYTRGARLTKHLRKAHNIRKPAGYSRFIYRHEGDGCYRLRTVRLESLEVSESTNAVGDAIPSQSRHAPKTIIDVVDEKGEVISSNSYSQEIMSAETLPPDATVVAVCSLNDV